LKYFLKIISPSLFKRQLITLIVFWHDPGRIINKKIFFIKEVIFFVKEKILPETIYIPGGSQNNTIRV